jgi:outer membrane protein TolC
MIRKISLVVLALLLLSANSYTQEKLNLGYCVDIAQKNYPLVKQRTMIADAKDMNVSNVWSGYYPQLTISGQATHQSDVTSLSINFPAFLGISKIPSVDKDQYKVLGEVSQTIYDGGIICTQSDVYKKNAELDDKRLDTEFHKVRDQVIQLYFSVLLYDEQLKQADLSNIDLGAVLSKMTGGLKYGVATQADVQNVQAEILKNNQRIIELKSARQASIAMLAILMNENIKEDAVFDRPEHITIDPDGQITRTELKVFEYQEQVLDEQKGLITAKILPKASAFFQGGYGNPGLNMMKNEAVSFYTAGVRLNWAISNLYTNSNERELTEVNKKLIGLQKETFLLNTKMALKQKYEEIRKLQELIKVDEDIVALRTKNKEIAKAQLDNGTISSNDLIREYNQEDIAKQNLVYHTIQLLSAEQNYKQTLEN